jgi:hypothetical protein
VFDDAAAQEKRWHMPIPDYQTLMLAVLRILGNGADHTAPAAIDALATEFQLTSEEREQLLTEDRGGGGDVTRAPVPRPARHEGRRRACLGR